MLLQTLLSMLLVSAVWGMPMEDEEDIIERSPRESQETPKDLLQKEEAVLLAGTLLKEIGKEAEAEAEKKDKSREADEFQEDDLDVEENPEDMEARSQETPKDLLQKEEAVLLAGTLLKEIGKEAEAEAEKKDKSREADEFQEDDLDVNPGDMEARSQETPKDLLQKEEAVLLAGTLLKEIGKEAEAEKKDKSREADEFQEDDLDVNPEDMETRSLEEDLDGDEEEPKREVEEAEEEDMEREAEEEQNIENLEERKAGRRHNWFKRLLKKFKKGETTTNKDGKKVTEYFTNGGYERALRHFNKFKPSKIHGRQGDFTGYIGKFGKKRISVKESSKENRATLTLEGRKRVVKLRY